MASCHLPAAAASSPCFTISATCGPFGVATIEVTPAGGTVEAGTLLLALATVVAAGTALELVVGEITNIVVAVPSTKRQTKKIAPTRRSISRLRRRVAARRFDAALLLDRGCVDI